MVNANNIPRRRSVDAKGLKMTQISEMYLFGTEKMMYDMPKEELDEWIEDVGIRTLPDGTVAIDPVMSVAECKEMFRTGLYSNEIGERLGFKMVVK